MQLFIKNCCVNSSFGIYKKWRLFVIDPLNSDIVYQIVGSQNYQLVRDACRRYMRDRNTMDIEYIRTTRCAFSLKELNEINKLHALLDEINA